MKKLLVANWKENPTTEREALSLFAKTAKVKRGNNIQVVVCPPVVYLEPLAKKFKSMRVKKNLALGAQDIFWENHGAYTGAVGPQMIQALHVSYVIIGHSEQRKFFHETDAMVNKKIKAAFAAGLHVILCVGEPLSIRKKGLSAAQKFIKHQLIKALSHVPCPMSHLVIAYEPIWAIGSGKNDSPKDAATMAKFIKKTAHVICHMSHVAVLYGGSVTGKNIADYIQYKNIDGALVGGASLNPKMFGQMIGRVAGNKP
jgi:triosephosphate isomerase